MANKAFINDKDIIEIKMDTDIKYYRLINFALSIASLSNRLDFSHKNILILVDLTETKTIEPLAKKLFTTMFSISIFDRLATFGSNEQLIEDMKDIAKEANRLEKVKAFKTRAEAEQWLLAHKI